MFVECECVRVCFNVAIAVCMKLGGRNYKRLANYYKLVDCCCYVCLCGFALISKLFRSINRICIEIVA